MPIPDYQAIMLPLLEFAGDKQDHSLREATNVLANHFKLTEEEKTIYFLVEAKEDFLIELVGRELI